MKITRIRHEPTKRFGKEIDINAKIKDFYKEVKKYNLDDIICIDETSIKSLQKRHHCYSDIGKRCVIKTVKIIITNHHIFYRKYDDFADFLKL